MEFCGCAAAGERLATQLGKGMDNARGWAGLPFLQPLHRFTPQLIQQRRGGKHRPCDLRRESAEHIGRVAQPAELFLEHVFGKTPVMRLCQTGRRLNSNRLAAPQCPTDEQGFVLRGSHMRRYWLAGDGCRRVEKWTDTAVQLRIVGPPYKYPGAVAVL